MNDINTPIRRAQVYRFLADAFLYPGQENWIEDTPLVAGILRELAPSALEVWGLEIGVWDLPALQAEHRRSFGLVGSLCYETEFGLPHEFRQSQELADIAGFYRAFGFNVGGSVHERPDHLAVEIEFMHVLALKEAYAIHSGIAEHAEVCADAQRKFLQDHLGRWVEPFAQSLARSAGEGVYVSLARFAAAFVLSEAARLGVTLEPGLSAGARPTPPPLEPSCDDCPIVAEQE